jgi:hypothetical protein
VSTISVARGITPLSTDNVHPPLDIPYTVFAQAASPNMVSTLEKRLLLSQLKLKVTSPRNCRVSERLRRLGR